MLWVALASLMAGCGDDEQAIQPAVDAGLGFGTGTGIGADTRSVQEDPGSLPSLDSISEDALPSELDAAPSDGESTAPIDIPVEASPVDAPPGRASLSLRGSGRDADLVWTTPESRVRCLIDGEGEALRIELAQSAAAAENDAQTRSLVIVLRGVLSKGLYALDLTGVGASGETFTIRYQPGSGDAAFALTDDSGPGSFSLNRLDSDEIEANFVVDGLSDGSAERLKIIGRLSCTPP